jgi:hypothetical protein
VHAEQHAHEGEKLPFKEQVKGALALSRLPRLQYFDDDPLAYAKVHRGTVRVAHLSTRPGR